MFNYNTVPRAKHLAYFDDKIYAVHRRTNDSSLCGKTHRRSEHNKHITPANELL